MLLKIILNHLFSFPTDVRNIRPTAAHNPVVEPHYRNEAVPIFVHSDKSDRSPNNSDGPVHERSVLSKDIRYEAVESAVCEC